MARQVEKDDTTAMPRRRQIPRSVRFEVFKRDGFKCAYCGAEAPDVVLHVDHLKPLAKGGSNDITNLVTACGCRNLNKGSRELTDDSAVKKQRRRLEALRERRDQIEMVIEWQEGLTLARLPRRPVVRRLGRKTRGVESRRRGAPMYEGDGEIRNVGDLVAAVHQCNEELAGGLWWRGQPRCGWSLQPKILREPQGQTSAADEQTLMNRFRLRAGVRYPRCPERNDHVGWLFLMQHYGYATRLLDWTESPLVAAFFAVAFEPGESHAEIFALDPVALNETQGLHGVFNPAKDDPPLFHGAFDRTVEVPPVIVATACDEFDIRMAVQQSAFTIHTTAEPLDVKEERRSFLRQLVIPAETRRQFAGEILALGFTRSDLFLDLDNLSKELLMRHDRAPWRA
jgi:hypothetical protein